MEKCQQQKVLINKCSQNWGIYSVFGFVFCFIYYCCISLYKFYILREINPQLYIIFSFCVCIICVWPDQFFKNLPVYRIDMQSLQSPTPPVFSGQIFQILFIAVYCRYFWLCYFFCAPIAHAKISKFFWLISIIPLYIHIQNVTYVNTFFKKSLRHLFNS